MKLDFSGLGAAGGEKAASPPRSDIDAHYTRERTIFREYQANIAKSERLRSEIIKGAAEGVEPEILLEKAAACISAMTSDPAVKRAIGDYLEGRAQGLNPDIKV